MPADVTMSFCCKPTDVIRLKLLLIPILGGLKWASHDAGVVDKDIKPAELGKELGDKLLDRSKVCEVHLHGGDLVALRHLVCLINSFLARLHVPVCRARGRARQD